MQEILRLGIHPRLSRSILFPFAVLTGQSCDPGSIAVGLQTELTFTLSNPNQIPASGIGFTAILPSGLTVTSAAASQCGGIVDISTSSRVTFSGGSLTVDDLLPGGSDACEIVASVQGNQLGNFVVDSFLLHATGWPDGTSNSTSLDVLFPAPTLAGPVDGSFWHGWRPTFTWYDVDGASNYRLLIDDDLGFTIQLSMYLSTLYHLHLRMICWRECGTGKYRRTRIFTRVFGAIHGH